MILLARSVLAWLTGSRAGHITLACCAAVLAVAIYGAKREADGRRIERARAERADTQAAERGHAARQGVRDRGDTAADSLRSGDF